MSDLRDNIHSVSALVTFELCARLGNFSLAAKALGVTQPAVSRQIRLLEADLNTALFSRAHRCVTLTPAGAALNAAVTGSFHKINTVIESIRRPYHPNAVVFGASLAFSHFWLMPRLSAFRSAHPQVKLRLIADDHLSDLRNDRLDISVRYGSPPFADAVTIATLPDEIFAGCSPQLKAQFKLDGATTALAQAPILRTDFVDPAWMSWRQWAHHIAASPMLSKAADQSALSFNHYADVIHAAMAGEGVALCWASLLGSAMAEGKLVRACHQSIVPDHRFHLLIRADQPLSKEAELMAGWLKGLFESII